ncbi:MAG TPA: hypothetical protein DDX91_02280, partial [Ruminococcaceae bacterium]|nr:hypothetical protein [Oscillospiraceae bacterium]
PTERLNGTRRLRGGGHRILIIALKSASACLPFFLESNRFGSKIRHSLYFQASLDANAKNSDFSRNYVILA